MRNIPFSDYTIDSDGVVRLGTDVIKETIVDGIKTVKIVSFLGYNVYPVALLMILAYCAPSIHSKYWSKIVIQYSDRNTDNVNINNLSYTFKTPIRYKRTDFVYMPMTTRYIINKKGVVKQQYSKETIKPIKLVVGYGVKLITDRGTSYTSTIKKLIGLAFRNERIRISKDSKLLIRGTDGIILPFSKVKDACAFLGISKQHIYSSLNNNLQNLIKDRYQIKLDNDSEWKVIKPTKNGALTRSVKAYCIETQEVTTFDACSECAEKFNLHRATLHYCITKQKAHSSGYMFKYADDESNWAVPDYLPGSSVPNEKKIIMSDTVNNTYTIYDSRLKCCEGEGITNNQLGYRLEHYPRVFDGKCFMYK